ncbi:phage antirepressor N-terminal domain-containing protein [Azotobacter vinelandii]|uniref:phage antirepressor N-terminal domain-containing protein n=1 Tax=Azotobacter vinelandii TaxID=354 RepID=UPI002666E755|nr:phage antirepressor N-terminal domain-containing protein [Azotobacter vinelandii]WKN21479.1 phage antirepressor N-terminal domain-containing protein [Azotobacter vinelandii]
MHSTAHIASVDFHGRPLTVITDPAGEHLVAMKPICEAIGLQWEAQRKRIQRHEVLKSVASVMEATAADGKRYEYICLPLNYLNGWLFGVDASRVKPEIRERLIQYQRECFGVLAAYWQQGEAVNPRKPRRPRLAPALDLDYSVSR